MWRLVLLIFGLIGLFNSAAALDKENDPKRSAWLTGLSEGLMAEADLLGPDWNPPEPEELRLIGFLGRIANGDKIKPEQTPRGRRDMRPPD